MEGWRGGGVTQRRTEGGEDARSHTRAQGRGEGAAWVGLGRSTLSVRRERGVNEPLRENGRRES